MKGRLLNLIEISILKDHTKVWCIRGDDDINELCIVDKPYIKNMLGETVCHFNLLDNYLVYKWIENENEYYHGDEILKMIRENKLEEGTELINENDVPYIVARNSDDNKLYLDLKNKNSTYEYPTSLALQFRVFKIKDKYLTFDEAVKIGKNFKYRTWGTFMPLTDVILEIRDIDEDRLEEMFKEKSWEVEV